MYFPFPNTKVSSQMADDAKSLDTESCVKDLIANIRNLKAMDLKTEDKAKVLDLLLPIRKALCRPTDPPISHVIQEDPMKHFIAILRDENSTDQMTFETIWILTNIASGTSDQTKVVVESGALDAVIPHLKHHSRKVAEHALWLIGNVCGDSVENRDMILLAGGAKRVLASYNKHVGNQRIGELESFLSTLYWVVSNLVRGKPLPKKSLVSSLANFVMKQMITIAQGSAVFNYADILRAAACLSASEFFAAKFSKSPTFLRAVIAKGLSTRGPEMHASAVLIMGQLCSCEEKVTQAVIDAGAIPVLADLYLRVSQTSLRSAILWVFSNITAGTLAQVQGLLACEEAVKVLLEGLRDSETSIVAEAVYAASNVLRRTHCGDLLDGEMLSALVEAMVTLPTHACFDLACFSAAAASLCNYVNAIGSGRLSDKDLKALSSIKWAPLIDVLQESQSQNASSLLSAVSLLTWKMVLCGA